jgi:acylphosphatase
MFRPHPALDHREKVRSSLHMEGLRIGRNYLISGRVQGVGFRYFTERAARASGVTGWVRNLADGRVEAHGNGKVEQLDRFEARLRMGPPRADVRGFAVTEAAPTDAQSFFIR